MGGSALGGDWETTYRKDGNWDIRGRGGGLVGEEGSGGRGQREAEMKTNSGDGG